MKESIKFDKLDQEALINITKQALHEGRIQVENATRQRNAKSISAEAKACMQQASFAFY